MTRMSAVPAAGPVRRTDQTLTWGLCVATLNRMDVLAECIRAALGQTRPPAEIVIVDASDDWEEHRTHIAPLVEGTGTRLTYTGSPKRSSAVQRNVGLARLGTDVAFLIDDDSIMEPGCAEAVLAVYEQDPHRRVAAVAAVATVGPAEKITEVAPAPDSVERKDISSLRHRRTGLFASGPMRWIRREILMMSTDRMFVKYDPPEDHFGLADFARLAIPDTAWTPFIGGCVMTVRREVVLKEPFDDHLLAYSPTEDLDTSYRFSRHGLNVVAKNARLAHLEAAANRVKRRNATMLALMNSAYFTRRHSERPLRHAAVYYVLSLRRLFAEFLKDLLSRRFTFPQFRGAARGLLHSPRVFLHPREGLGEWYEKLQAEMLRK